MAGTRRRFPPLAYRPARTYVYAGVLLAVTTGLIAAGALESGTAGDWGWFALFVAGDIGCIVLYYYVVHAWIAWTIRSREYSDVVPQVFFLDEYRDHQHPDKH